MSTPATIARFGYWPVLALTFFLTFLLVAAWALAVPVQADESTKPERPTGLRIATEQGSLDVGLTWDDVPGAAHYLVRWRHVDTQEKLNEGVEVQASRANITLAAYGEWVVRVQACNDAGCGSPLAKQFRVEPTPTPTPTPIPQPPTWATTGTTGQLPENDDTSESLVDLRATDPDGADSEISYAITAGSTSLFSLTAKQTGTTPYVSLDYAGAAQDYESLSNPAAFATVTVRATDESGITVDRTVTISVTDVNEAPAFSDGASVSRSLPENSAANVNVGAPISATDPEQNTLTYTLAGTDAASFSIGSSTGQLSTKAGVTYDFETKPSYSLTVTATDTGNPALADTITVTVTLTDVNEPPVFSEGESATRSVPEDSGDDVNVGAPIAATDPEGNTLTYSLTGVDAADFAIDPATGQLSTDSSAPFDFETKPSFAFTVTVSDGLNLASIPVTVTLTDVNEAPVFGEGASTVRSLPENSGDNVNVGDPISATDPERDTLTYSLTGTDAASFTIDGATGQLSTTTGITYDFETKSSYSLTVTATDTGAPALSDTIAVTVNLTDVNEPPVFSDGASAARSLPENSAANVNVGAPISATDQDRGEGPLTYALTGADAASFAFNTETG